MDAGKKKIWVRGQFVEVTDEVYTAYMRGDRKMRYFEADLKSERPVYGSNGEIKQVLPSREDSLDRLMEENARQFAAAAGERGGCSDPKTCGGQATYRAYTAYQRRTGFHLCPVL